MTESLGIRVVRILAVLSLFHTLFSFTAPAECVLASEAAGVTLLENREYGSALIRGIRNARSSIVCSFFLFKIGSGLNNQPLRIAQELVNARQRGVSVKVILEQNGKYQDQLNDDNRQAAAVLARGGVKVRFDSPEVTSHSKIAVIDNRYVYMGSHNITQAALLHNNELSVCIDSPEIARHAISALERE